MEETLNADLEALIADTLEAWRVHDAVNAYLLGHISDAGLEALTLLKSGQPSGGRSVRRVFAHMLEVRLGKIPRRFHGDLSDAAGPDALEWESLQARLKASGLALERLLHTSLRRDPQFKNPLRVGMRLYAYLIAHESHHRGQIMLALKQSGTLMREERRFGMWSMWFDSPTDGAG